MKRLAILAIIVCAWFHLTPAHAQFNGCSSFCGTSSSAIADAPGFNNFQSSGSGSTLACTYTPVTSGTQNVAYTGATPSASGGVPAYTFAETGALPTGLSINSSTGVISGTPSVAGSFPSIQVKVTDTALNTVNCGASFTLVIAPALPVVSFVSVIAATNSGTTYTNAAVNIGNPAYIGTRRVIAFLVGGGNSINLSGSTINGVAADSAVTLGTSGNNDGVYLMSAVVPSGTTGVTVTAQMSGSVFGAASFCVYNVDNSLLSSHVPVTNWFEVNPAALTGTVTANSLAGGFILSGLASATSGTTTSLITASTETYTQDATNNNNRNSCAHANGVGTDTPSSVTWSWNGSSIAGLGMATFR